MSTRIIVDEDEPVVDVDDAPFQPRDVTIRTDKWVKDEFEILDFLGRGKFGEVKRCRERCSGKEYAAKFICAPRPQDKKDVEHEIDIMQKLQHKRLIQLYDAFESKSEMCLVLEIIYGGELFDRVISEDFVLTEKACVCFVRQICEGLEYMHVTNIIHLDMKPENILCLSRTGNRIKIIDFGLAREYDIKKDLRVLFGTPEFMAPEVVQYEPINFATDMWSVGVICYVLLSGLSPFMGDNDGETLGNVIKGEFDFDYPEFDDVSEEARDLIANLLVKEKSQRLTASECLAHSWLKKEREPTTPTLQLSKRRLKRFVYRRKWQKIVHAIIALKRMGVQLMSIQRDSIGDEMQGEAIFNKWDGATTSSTGSTSTSVSQRSPLNEGPSCEPAAPPRPAAEVCCPDAPPGGHQQAADDQNGLSQTLSQGAVNNEKDVPTIVANNVCDPSPDNATSSLGHIPYDKKSSSESAIKSKHVEAHEKDTNKEKPKPKHKDIKHIFLKERSFFGGDRKKKSKNADGSKVKNSGGKAGKGKGKAKDVNGPSTAAADDNPTRTGPGAPCQINDVGNIKITEEEEDKEKQNSIQSGFGTVKSRKKLFENLGRIS